MIIEKTIFWIVTVDFITTVFRILFTGSWVTANDVIEYKKKPEIIVKPDVEIKDGEPVKVFYTRVRIGFSWKYICLISGYKPEIEDFSFNVYGYPTPEKALEAKHDFLMRFDRIQQEIRIAKKEVYK